MPGSSSLGFVQSSPRLASVVDESHMDDQHHRLPRRSPAPLSISSSLRPEEDVRVPVPRRLLLGWNGAMFLFHSLLAFVTLYVGNRDLMVPIYRTVLEFSFRDEADESAGWDILPVYAPSGTLPPHLAGGPLLPALRPLPPPQRHPAASLLPLRAGAVPHPHTVGGVLPLRPGDDRAHRVRARAARTATC